MIADSLQKQYQRGLLIGSRSMLKVIGDKIAEEGKTTEEKLAEIMKMVNNMLAMTDKTEENEKEAIENPVDTVLGKPEEEEPADEPSEESDDQPKVVTVPDPEDDDE
jgi:uncharacterized membrane protein YukC